MRQTVAWILGVSLLLASAVPSSAQTFGQISGQVTDASGGLLVGATVTVTNTQTNAVREAQTNTSGSYSFPALLPGVYNIKVDLQGFQSQVRSGVELQVQQTARLDFSLELGSVEVAVEVTGSAPMINATDATVGTVINNKEILELPLNGRNFISLVSSIPNVSSDWAGGGGGGASGRQGGDRSTQNFAVAGQRREYNQYTLDGIVNQDVNFNTYAFLPSIDSLEEFKVQTGVYSAEFGREVAQVNVSTKSGTNAVSRNDLRVCAQRCVRRRAVSVHGCSSRKHRRSSGISMGSRVGGPVQIPGLFNGANKLFFMSNFEGFRLRNQQEVVFSTPRVAMRNGDFSQGRRSDQRSPDRSAVPRQPDSEEPVGSHRHQAAGVVSRAEYSRHGTGQELPRAAAPRDRQGSVHAAHRFRRRLRSHSGSAASAGPMSTCSRRTSRTTARSSRRTSSR